MKGIYKFYVDCGRMGEISGIFAEHDFEIKRAIGKEVYFGEILGKHSDVSLVLEEEHFTCATQNEEFVDLFELYELDSGYNPLNYFRAYDDED